MQNAFACIEVV